MFQVRWETAWQVRWGHRLWEASCRDLWSWLCFWGRSWGVPWQDHRFSCWRSWGAVWPEPPENLQAADKAGSPAGPQARVHHRPQGDVPSQVLPAQAGGCSSADQVVSWPNPSSTRAVLRRRPGLRGSTWPQWPRKIWTLSFREDIMWYWRLLCQNIYLFIALNIWSEL